MKIKRKLITLPAAAIFAFAVPAGARENGATGRAGGNSARVTTQDQLASSCTPASAKTDLDINNVRTTIMTGGDMWWDLGNNAKYEIPRGGNAHSLFAGALWIGGLDGGGQLKVAAMTYRQQGNDFWPGPLNTAQVSIDAATCAEYDKHWKITRKEVEDFLAWRETGAPANYVVPQSIQTWPGNGESGQDHYLAPFVDVDDDGWYNWQAGDYPAYNVDGSLGCDKFQIYGDQTLWWVFNDRGNVHSESGAESIGLEVHAQAFAFSTNDEINNMTFYSYKIINRSTLTMNQTYFGQWTDADLGAYDDDFVGCDVERGLGYTYNGDQDDGTSSQPAVGTYGSNPPAIGIDFFEGPASDPNDGIDNDRDGLLDEDDRPAIPGFQPEQIIMSKFVYYENDASVRGNPELAFHYYNYLSGFWKDGSPFTYGGNAYGGMRTCDFMFPGNSDLLGWGTDMQPQQAWNDQPPAADRRMLLSAGPFTLQPGAVNYITVGAVWARASSGGPTASVELMRKADDRAQRLFDNCFRTLDGPDAPDLTIQELDKELILYLTNKPTSNNYLERYEDYDPAIGYTTYDPTLANIDTTYNFEGYQVFQLKDATVSTSDLYNPDKARLVFQSDIRNNVAMLVNREYSEAINADVPMDMTIQADNEGLEHSFSVTEDVFASGDRRLVNHKTYYFMVLSYAYNEYLPYGDFTFEPTNPFNPSNIGQKKPYLAGRRNVKVYAGIPHFTSPEAGGTNQQSGYGSGPKITRLEGSGSGPNVLELTEASENAIVYAQPVGYIAGSGWTGTTARVNHIQYENGRLPFLIIVIDPLYVPLGDFTIEIFINPSSGYLVKDTARWVLRQVSPEVRSWSSDTTINIYSRFRNEQIIPEIGLSVSLSQVQAPGFVLNSAAVAEYNPDKNGYLESSMTFSDPTKDWLSGVADDDSPSESNWIRAGTVNHLPINPCDDAFNDRHIIISQTPYPIDPEGDYEKVVDGLWGPYRLTADNARTSSQCYFAGPAYAHNLTMTQNKFENIASVNIVFTNDKSKCTRVRVFEVGPNPSLNEVLVESHLLRIAASVDKQGKTTAQGGNPAEADLVSSTGMGWFPGYAVNVETGERLNMAFGENSGLVAERGRDMQWNPTANERSTFFDPLFGGQHYIYVFGHNGNQVYPGNFPAADLQNQLRDVPAYDEGRAIMKIMQSTARLTERTEVWRDAMWVSIPLLDEEFASWNFSYEGQVLPCDVKVRIRVARPYKRALTAVVPNASSPWIGNDTVFVAQNGNNPLYAFNTADLRVTTGDAVSAKNALELINVVPNPYYAYSGYETNQLDNRVKFTNLPEKCSIRIYTVSGILIRKLTKDSPQTSLDWDLKNQAGIPVASGLYIVHVDVPGVGEKILKWFGVMRPADLDFY